MANLAVFYVKEGSHKKAKALFEKALSLAEEDFGKESLPVADVLEKMSNLFYAQGNFYECFRLREQAKNIRAKTKRVSK